VARARDYAGQAKAASTWRAYRIAWADFTGWCALHGQTALPAAPETIMLYITARADGWKVSTLVKNMTAISVAHQMAGHPSPLHHASVRTVMQGIRRAKGVAPAQKTPVVTADIRRMVEMLPEGLLGIRDRALLLGFAGAFRRAELVELNVDDVVFTDDGATVVLRRGKTDQESAGRKIGIPFGSHPQTCPVRALRAWLAASAITAGPLFHSVNRHGQLQPERLSAQAVALVVKRCAKAVGLDALQHAGLSLRAGHATGAAAAGASERVIMNQTGHRSTAMVRRYIREASLFQDNSAASLGL
jgi:integrase